MVGRYGQNADVQQNVRKVQKRKKDLAQLTLQKGPIREQDLTFGRLQVSNLDVERSALQAHVIYL
jgi:hypothetical protein